MADPWALGAQVLGSVLGGKKSGAPSSASSVVSGVTISTGTEKDGWETWKVALLVLAAVAGTAFIVKKR